MTFAPQANFAFTLQNVGADEFVDSDADATGRSDVFAATYDEAVHLVGAGYVADCRLALVDVEATPSDCGDARGSLRFAVTGGSGDYTYAWLPDVSTAAAADELAAGEYTVTVTDVFTGCTRSEVLTVPGTSNFNLTASSSPAACPLGKGGSVTLFTNGGTGPFAVSYTGPATASVTAAAMPFTIADLYAGTYVVTVGDAAGCTQSQTVAVAENPMLLALAVEDIVRPTCAGRADGSFAITVTGFEDRYAMTVNGLTVAQNSNAARVAIGGQTSGEIAVEVRDVNDCAQTLTFTLDNGGPSITLADLQVVDPRCAGEASGVIRSLDFAPYEVRTAAGALAGTLPLDDLVAGDYTVVDRRDPGCVATLDLTLVDPPAIGIAATVVGTDCDLTEGRIALELSGGTGAYRVQWADVGGGSLTRDRLAAGDYVVTVRDSLGCVRTDTIVVPDGCRPLVCEDYFTADTLVVYAEAGVDYTWCGPNFTQPIRRTFTVNGVAANPAICTRSELVYYNLEGLPGDGADGPYRIDFWFGGDDVVVGALTADGAGLARALDGADAWGRWRYDPTSNFVSGGQPGRTYGEIEVTHVRSGNVFFLTPDHLPNQLSGSLRLPLGAYDVRTTRGDDGCVDSLYLIVRPVDACREAFAPASTTTATPYCDQPAPVCIDVPTDLLATHDLLINGQPYVGPVEPCANDDVVYYDLKGLDLGGAFRMSSWVVDGVSRTARLASAEELAARMTQFDGLTWRYDAALGVIRGGLASGGYRDLELVTVGGGVRLAPQRGLSDGTRIQLLAGTYRAELVGPTGCGSAFSVSLRCSARGIPTRDTVRWTTAVGFADSACVSVAELTGAIDLVADLCPGGADTFALLERIDTVCYRYAGLAIGVDTVCLQVCDLNGVCDTTVVLIDVRDPGELLLPIAVNDTVEVPLGERLDVPALANDDTRGELLSFEVIGYPRNGRIRFGEGGGLEYRPEPQFCGSDSLTYEICNAYGCDEALVYVTIECTDLVIYSGFSPNFDGINDAFTVRGIEQYPDNRMEVYNRGGNLVFEMDRYDNSWDGTYFDGDELPEGTYYYVFDDGRGREHTGYVYLRRYGR